MLNWNIGGNLGDNSRVYTSSKTLEINGKNYEFSFFSLYNKTNKAWSVGFSSSPSIYLSATAFSDYKFLGVEIGISKTHTFNGNFYTEPNSTGEKITITANIKV